MQNHNSIKCVNTQWTQLQTVSNFTNFCIVKFKKHERHTKCCNEGKNDS